MTALVGGYASELAGHRGRSARELAVWAPVEVVCMAWGALAWLPAAALLVRGPRSALPIEALRSTLVAALPAIVAGVGLHLAGGAWEADAPGTAALEPRVAVHVTLAGAWLLIVAWLRAALRPDALDPVTDALPEPAEPERRTGRSIGA